jgi:hypothetical protein
MAETPSDHAAPGAGERDTPPPPAASADSWWSDLPGGAPAPPTAAAPQPGAPHDPAPARRSRRWRVVAGAGATVVVIARASA